MNRRPRRLFALGLLASVGGASPAPADDWPQWMGPQRDNAWRESGLVDAFPDGGPAVVWRAPVAHGYAGPAVADGRVFVADFVTDADVDVDNFGRAKSPGTERLLCLDQATGDVLWTHKYPVTYTVSYPAGPRCTPTVDDGKVYALGAEGDLHCLDAATGDVLWKKNFPADYGAATALWGYASHPLVDGDKLLCVVGGEGSYAVAFDKTTGAELWRTLTSPSQAYSPPAIIESGGVRQLILARPDAISSVDPESGREYWSVPYNADGGCVIMTPVYANGYLYVGGFNNKSLLLKLADDRPAADVVWHDKGKDAIAAINVQPFAVDGVLYGVDQRGDLRAIDLAAGAQLWSTSQPISARPEGSGTAFLVRQEGVAHRVWLFTEKGDLVIADLTPEAFTEIDRAHVIAPTGAAHGRDVVWSMPAFAGRRAFVRNDEECVCLDLAAQP